MMRQRKSDDDAGWMYVWSVGGYWLRVQLMRRVMFRLFQSRPHVMPMAFRLAEPSVEPPEMVRW